MNLQRLKLAEEEVKKFYDFFEEHLKCSSEEAMSSAYNVKLVFNFGNDAFIVTCLCSVCGSEDLIAQPRLYEEEANEQITE